MPFTDEQAKYIFSQYPDSAANNTEFCLRVWETACQQHNIDFPDEVKWAIRQYKPEAIVRKRRELVDSTEEQLKEEVKYREHYKK